jgi:hypothetical protein
VVYYEPSLDASKIAQNKPSKDEKNTLLVKRDELYQQFALFSENLSTEHVSVHGFSSPKCSQIF